MSRLSRVKKAQGLSDKDLARMSYRNPPESSVIESSGNLKLSQPLKDKEPNLTIRPFSQFISILLVDMLILEPYTPK